MSRILKTAVDQARADGHQGRAVPAHHAVAVPDPRDSSTWRSHAAGFVVVELSTGQMVEDVRLAVEGRRPVEFYGRAGGNVPTADEVLDFVTRVASIATRPIHVVEEVAA